MAEYEIRQDQPAHRPNNDDDTLTDAELGAIAGGTNRAPAPHSGGAQMLMGDGSVHFLRDDLNLS